MFIFLRRHARFLRVVFFYTLSAFGGPQGHFALMQRLFVERERLISQQELMDLNLFTQILPGPASTQMLGLLAYKKGGPYLSLLVLSIWIFPATFLMICMAIFYSALKDTEQSMVASFSYLGIMALAFFLSYCLKMWETLEKRRLSIAILGLTFVITLVFFHSPWLFPLVIILGGILSYVRNVREKRKTKPLRVKLYWGHLFIFLALFFVSGIFSETARIRNWEHRKIFNVVENNYRFGTLVFGGGQVLVPMLYEKYASAQKTSYVPKEDILNGAGLLQLVPGPVFSITTFVSALVFEKEGKWWEILGGTLATIAIFLPGYFLCIFFYPIWQKMRGNNIIFKSMLGLSAALVGLLMGSFVYLLFDHPFSNFQDHRSYVSIIVFLATLYYIRHTRYPPAFLVLAVIFLGWVDFLCT